MTRLLAWWRRRRSPYRRMVQHHASFVQYALMAVHDVDAVAGRGLAADVNRLFEQSGDGFDHHTAAALDRLVWRALLKALDG